MFSFSFMVFLIRKIALFPGGAITVPVVNYCNLRWIYPSWYQFNSPIQAVIVLSKSRLEH